MPHLDYGDIIYDQPNNQAFSNKLEAVQYNAALAITGAIWGTSKTKIYQELGLESLKSCRWFRRLCYFYKIKNYGLPEYLFQLISVDTHSCNTRISENIATYYCRTDTFKHSFFPLTIAEWNKLDLKCCKCTYNVFRNHLLKSIRPLSNCFDWFTSIWKTSSFDKIQNKKILAASIKYIVDSERFSGSIFQYRKLFY